ncbi:hypothetical protein ACER0A_002115 [Haloimpatiens sp. FM7315]|uniref:hypothetical protein n=1 Tax=Haloimpatiens sp. FM7315 TaxID=3298609 RepID=UPI0035A3A229
MNTDVEKVIKLYFKGYSVERAVKIVKKDVEARKRLYIKLIYILHYYNQRRNLDATL